MFTNANYVQWKYYTLPPDNFFCYDINIRRNLYYYHRRKEEDTHNCFCATLYKNARGRNITFDRTFVSKTNLNKRKNNRECEEMKSLTMSLYYTSFACRKFETHI